MVFQEYLFVLQNIETLSNNSKDDKIKEKFRDF